ncbi:hypothetical protein SOVF_072790 [Spinacia oleracea]|nr:hypothetical protein SOVF_072790 [Spinacia oleracea]
MPTKREMPTKWEMPTKMRRATKRKMCSCCRPATACVAASKPPPASLPPSHRLRRCQRPICLLLPSQPTPVSLLQTANRSAKLKQCKLDARREQWLLQGLAAESSFKFHGKTSDRVMKEKGETLG